MLASALRVTGTDISSWDITHEASSERYSSGYKELQEGNRTGLVKMLYTRVFYPDRSGNFEGTGKKGTINTLLGLEEENLDEATERALERAKANPWPF
jgi:hypothetical protein